MGESRWEKEQRWLNEDHAARRAESRRQIELDKGRAEIKATEERIAAAGRAGRPISPEYTRLQVEWSTKKPKLIERIATQSDLPADTRAAWCRTLESTLFAARDTSDLVALRDAVRATTTQPLNQFLRWDWGMVLLADAVDELITLSTEGRRHLWA
jgi:hypothetical protein